MIRKLPPRPARPLGRSTLACLACLVLAALLSAAAWAKPLVVVSIHPYYDLARQIAGEAAEVTRLLPLGASPHTFEPAPSHARQVARADLLIMNGGVGVDEWLSRLVEASGTSAPLLVIMDQLELDAILEEGHEHDHAEPGAATAQQIDAEAGAGRDPAPHYVNPHVWLDVRVALGAASAIEAALSEVDPQNADTYRANAERLRAELEALDAELLELLAPVRGAAFVPFHNAWPYFARRYGLDLVVEIEPFPGREPSPAYLRDALRLIAASDARALFSERQLSQRPAQVVAEMAGLPLYVLDPEGGGTSDSETYQDLMRYNARTILEALGD